MLAIGKSTGFAAVALWVMPALAHGATPGLRVGLDYDERAAPVDCPTGAELRAAVAQRLGYDPFVDAEQKPELVVHIEMRRGARGTEADIAWRSAAGALDGERQLAAESDQCAEIASGVVFAVAVQLELRAVSAPPPAPPPVAKPPPPKPPPRPAPVVASYALLAGVGAFVQRGIQPAAAPGLRSFGAVRGKHWSLGLEAHGTLPTELRTPSGSGFSARTLGLGLFPCVRAAPWEVCLLGDIGQLSVRGQGVDRVNSPSSVFLGFGLRFQVTWPEIGPLATLLHVDAWAPVTPRDVLINHEDVWGTAPIAFQAGLDVAAIFR